LLFCLFVALPARADTVRVMRNDNTWGQGWMFLDPDGICKVVTAAHVVSGLDGKFIAPMIEDGRRRVLTTGAPIVLSKSPDIAVLPLPGVQGSIACGAGRLSGIGAARRAGHLSNPLIFTTGKTETQHIKVESRASAMDQGDGEVFAVRPTDPNDHVVEGWSGSPVVDDDGLIGIVFQVDGKRNEAGAIRVDVVRRLMDAAGAVTAAAPATATATASLAGFSVFAGATADSSRGPDQLLHDGGVGWLVKPRAGSVVFSAVLREPRQLHGVLLGLSQDTAPELVGFMVETQAEGADGDWVGAAYCRSEAGAFPGVECSFAPRTVVAVRLALKVTGMAPVAITKFLLH